MNNDLWKQVIYNIGSEHDFKTLSALSRVNKWFNVQTKKQLEQGERMKRWLEEYQRKNSTIDRGGKNPARWWNSGLLRQASEEIIYMLCQDIGWNMSLENRYAFCSKCREWYSAELRKNRMCFIWCKCDVCPLVPMNALGKPNQGRKKKKKDKLQQ